MRLVGLTGKAMLPVTLGFGCNAVATLATRTLESRRQRFIACFLVALGVPCAVQMGAMVAILSSVPVGAIGGLFVVVTALIVASGALLARVLPRSEHGEFIMELPPLRSPRWSSILAKTWHRLAEFLTETLPLFVAGAGLLLVLHFTGLLGHLRAIMAPVVVRGLRLPVECADMLLMTLARREVGAIMMKQMVDAGTLSLRQIFVGLLVMILFVPCVSNTVVLGRVVGWRSTVAILVLVAAIDLGVGVLVSALWT